MPFLLNLVDAYDIVSLEFVRHSTVANTRDHGGHGVAQLHEVFRADRVKETLAKGNFAEFETVTGRVSVHRAADQLGWEMSGIRITQPALSDNRCSPPAQESRTFPDSVCSTRPQP